MNVPFSYASPTLSVEALKHSIAYKLMFIIGKDPAIANKHEWLNATLFAVRDRMVERWLRSNRAQLSQEVRQVYYLSMEFLIGRTLSNALLSLGIYDDVSSALAEMGLDLEELIDEENDPGLGNGGLGRLAACFLDSLAALGLPGRGYGIRYDYGMFKQNIVDGRQKESPDYWLEYGNPWEFERHNTRYKVRFGGRIQQEGKKTRWIETEEIIAEAYDQIIPGFDTDATNTLRLWSAQASSEINLGKFNQGDYFAAVEDKNHSENVSRVLYPDDSTYSGRELRLRQEYFLVSATVQDILSRHYMLHKTYDNLADKIAIHLNDTHPVLSIPELMRLLIDEHKFSWDEAFEVTCQVFSYTNHTLMSEALETWPCLLYTSRVKADPYAFESQMRPESASLICDLPPKVEQPADRRAANQFDAPISIYEVHLGSWRRHTDNNFWLSYRELADQLVPYAKWMGFTHLELLPVNEHPFDGSWGYQPTGLYAPTRRFGTRDDFRYFINAAHAAGLNVILDWVPGHFPADDFALASFDGTSLYEHSDPREGYHLSLIHISFTGWSAAASLHYCSAVPAAAD